MNAGLRWAEALCRHGSPAFELDPDNRRGRDLAVAEAVAAGVPFAVPVRPDVVVVDYDAAESGTEAVRNFEAALEGAGVPLIRVPSGRAGHWHLYAYVGAPRRHWAERLAEACGAKARLKVAIRPPFAPHRRLRELDGRPVRALPDRGSEWFLALLERAPKPGAPYDRPGLPVGLAERVRTGAGGPTRADGGLDRSRNDWGVLVRLVLAGWSDDHIVELFGDPALCVSHKTRDRGQAYLWRSLYRARRFVAEHPPVRSRAEVIEVVADLLGRLETCPSAPFGGPTGKAYLTEVLRQALDQGSLTRIRLPDGEVALRAGMATETARRYRHRLIEAGWLVPGDDDGPGTARTYELRCLSFRELYSNTGTAGGCEGECPQIETIPDSRHPVWRRGVVGPVGREILLVLSAGAAGPAELVRVTGLPRQTVQRHLKALLGLRVVKREARGSWALEPDVDWDALAESLPGGRQAHKRQAQRLEADRAAYAQAAVVRLAHRLDRPEILERYRGLDTRRVGDTYTGEVLSVKEMYAREYARSAPVPLRARTVGASGAEGVPASVPTASAVGSGDGPARSPAATAGAPQRRPGRVGRHRSSADVIAEAPNDRSWTPGPAPALGSSAPPGTSGAVGSCSEECPSGVGAPDRRPELRPGRPRGEAVAPLPGGDKPVATTNGGPGSGPTEAAPPVAVAVETTAGSQECDRPSGPRPVPGPVASSGSPGAGPAGTLPPGPAGAGAAVEANGRPRLGRTEAPLRSGRCPGPLPPEEELGQCLRAWADHRHSCRRCSVVGNCDVERRLAGRWDACALAPARPAPGSWGFCDPENRPQVGRCVGCRTRTALVRHGQWVCAACGGRPVPTEPAAVGAGDPLPGGLLRCPGGEMRTEGVVEGV